MTQPRHVARGKVLFLSRRIVRRHFLFRPDDDGEMQNTFWYCLAAVAQKFGMVIHVAILMSDHLHVILTDVHGVYPHFLREFHRLLANATKCHRGWPEEVFNADSTSVVQLLDANAIIGEAGYTIANPVSAGAVRHAHEWPGAKVLPEDIGTRFVVARRPSFYFRADNPSWPERIELPITMPQQIIDELGSADAGREAIAAEVRRHEEIAWHTARQRGLHFRGPRQVMRLPITARASSWEEFGSRNPTFSARGNQELASLAVLALRTFRAAYREALDLWRCGVRDAVFPLGTWLMRVVHHVTCEPAPLPD